MESVEDVAVEDEQDEGPEPVAGRHSRKLSRRVRHALSQAGVRLLGVIVPWLYVAYCWLVWKTSRVEDRSGAIARLGERHGRAVCLIWHQEVFTVAWGYRHLRPHTLASTGNFGHLITRMLELCGYVVFRGGSSRGTARRRRVLPEMISHMRRSPRVIYGITVDGSNGPVFRLKPGGPMIARVCRAPVLVVRTWCRRRIELPTWDRTVIPLPFNHIVIEARGPYWLDPQASAVEFQRQVDHLEQELLALADHSARRFAPAGEPSLRPCFPPGWTSPWPQGSSAGLKQHPLDLQEETWPEWAHLPKDRPAADRAPEA